MSAIVAGLGALAAALGIGLRKAMSTNRAVEHYLSNANTSNTRNEAKVEMLRAALYQAQEDAREAREELMIDRSNRHAAAIVSAHDDRLKSARNTAEKIRSRSEGRQ